MTGAVGRLLVELTVRAGAVVPRIRHTPGLSVAPLLIGRPKQQAAVMVPAILNLCAAAHRQAATAAVGLGLGDGTASRWETIRDHGLAILRDWPACLGGAAGHGSLGALAAIGAGGDRDDAVTALRRQLVGDHKDATRFGRNELGRWLTEGATPTARLLAEIRRRFDPALGRVALPAPVLADLTASIPPAREVTCADRVRGEPLLVELEAVEGRSLFVRLLGRLFDLLRCLDGREADLPTSPPGIGVAEASRGRLIHMARLDGDRIAAYRIVTPTDWNLADDGLLLRMLTSLPPDERLESAARLALACVDPCVPTKLQVIHA